MRSEGAEGVPSDTKTTARHGSLWMCAIGQPRDACNRSGWQTATAMFYPQARRRRAGPPLPEDVSSPVRRPPPSRPCGAAGQTPNLAPRQERDVCLNAASGRSTALLGRSARSALEKIPFCDRQQLQLLEAALLCSATFPYDGSISPPLGCYGEVAAARGGAARPPSRPPRSVLAGRRSPIRT